jgi:hypothetical protein
MIDWWWLIPAFLAGILVAELGDFLLLYFNK